MHIARDLVIGVHVNSLNLAIQSMLTKCFQQGRCVFIVGDLNINFMTNQNQLQSECDTYDLKQIIKDPTCFKSRNNPTLLDFI